MPDLNSLRLDNLDSTIGVVMNCTLVLMARQYLRQLCTAHPRLTPLLWRASLVESAICREWVVSVG